MPLSNVASDAGLSPAAGMSAGVDTSASAHLAASASAVPPFRGQLTLHAPQCESAASIALLPPDTLASIVHLLDHRSRRHLAQADRRHRALFSRHRRLDRLTASLRWCAPGQMVQRLREAEDEPPDIRMALLHTAMERRQGIRTRDRDSVALALVHHIGGLPPAMREGMLLELAKTLGDGNRLQPAVDEALLRAANAVSPSLRARLLAARCGPPQGFIGPDEDGALTEALELARLLPHAEALPFLYNKLRSFIHPHGVAGKDAAAIIDIAVSASEQDETLSAPAQQLLGVLLYETGWQDGADAGALRAAMWDALFRLACARNSCPVQRSDSIHLLAIVAEQAAGMAPSLAAPRAEQVRQLIAVQPQMVRTRIPDSPYCVKAGAPVEEPYAWAQRCLDLARELDPAGQSAMYASCAATLFIPPRQPGREAQWRALYITGLRQIAELDRRWRFKPLLAWARALDNIPDRAAFEVLASQAAAFPDTLRARILSACHTGTQHVPDFDGLLVQLESMDPDARVPLLRQLAVFVSRQPSDVQQQRFPRVLTAVTRMPAAARAALLPSLLRIASFCWPGALEQVLPAIGDTLAELPMSTHASMLADVPNHNMRSVVMAWLLAQLPALQARQHQNALAGHALPYRAEILRRMLFAVNNDGKEPGLKGVRMFAENWPQLRAALEAAEPSGRDGVLDELAATLFLLRADLRREVAALINTL